jgi:hypothetical protein
MPAEGRRSTVTGKNSFTSAQARTRLQKHGYRAVSAPLQGGTQLGAGRLGSIAGRSSLQSITVGRGHNPTDQPLGFCINRSAPRVRRWTLRK